MLDPNVQLENRSVVLCRNETTYGVDAIAAAILAGTLPTPFATDAMLCEGLDVKANTNVLERNNYSSSLSKDTVGIGRMLLQLTFKAEFRASGVLGTAPRIGKALKACGMAETIVGSSAGATINNPVASAFNTSAGAAAAIAAVTKTTAPTTCFDTYRVTWTTAGAPGTAKYVITGAGFPEGDPLLLNSLTHTAVVSSLTGVVTVGGTIKAPTFVFTGTWSVNDYVELFVGGIRFFYLAPNGSQTNTTMAAALQTLMVADARFVGSTAATGTITTVLAGGAGEITSSATSQTVTLGTSGAVITIGVYTGSVIVGEYFEVTLRRPGVRYDPVSDVFASATFWVYMDGQLQRLRGCRGTFSIDGQSAQYAKISFTFTCLYDDPVDQALPSGLVFEDSKPWKTELAQFAVVGAGNAGASKFTFDLANTVTPKEDINADEGYSELRITDRSPAVGADPQSERPSFSAPWARARRADTSRFHVSVGRKGGPGNICRIQADRTNFSEVSFAARDKIRTYDFKQRCARVTANGDDECFLHFG